MREGIGELRKRIDDGRAFSGRKIDDLLNLWSLDVMGTCLGESLSSILSLIDYFESDANLLPTFDAIPTLALLLRPSLSTLFMSQLKLGSSFTRHCNSDLTQV